MTITARTLRQAVKDGLRKLSGPPLTLRRTVRDCARGWRSPCGQGGWGRWLVVRRARHPSPAEALEALEMLS